MPFVFLRILLAYDDSAGSRIALEYACALSRTGAALTVAHAVNEYSIIASAVTAGGYSGVDPAPLIEEMNESGARLLHAAVDACATNGVVADRVLLHESAAGAVVELAQARQIDLIIVGTHGRHGMARVALGSVAEDILRASRVPVLVVNGHARSPQGTSLFGRALVALDDSDTSRTALTIAARLSQYLATHLILCNATDTRMHATAYKMLARLAKTNFIVASEDDLIVVEGEPAAAVEHAATQHNCDLIVLGSHARRGLERLVLGSVAQAVLRCSSLPVLVVPPRLRAV